MLVNFITHLLSFLTFPGIVVHEIAHKFFCDLTQTPVYSVCYFALGSHVSGKVVHKKTTRIKQVFLINIGPLIINTLLCTLFTLPLLTNYKIFGTFHTTSYVTTSMYLFLAWLGFSIGLHAFPSRHDIHNIAAVLKKPRKKPVSKTIVITTKILQALTPLRYIGLDIAYAWIISSLLPSLM